MLPTARAGKALPKNRRSAVSGRGTANTTPKRA